MKERILAAMTAALIEQEVLRDDLGKDVHSGAGAKHRTIFIDGHVHLAAVAEAIARVVGPKTETITIAGEPMAAAMASRLVEMSQWFQFEPMPDGKYEFTIKQELMQRLVNNGYVQMQEVNSVSRKD